MRQTVKEGLDLAEQLAALPFRAARQLFRESEMSRRPMGEVVQESLRLGEGLARLPFKATAAVLTEMASPAPSLEQRVAMLEQKLGSPADTAPPDLSQTAEPPPPAPAP